MACTNLDIEVNYEDLPKPPPVDLSKKFKKFKFNNWRINVLAIPDYFRPKYVPEIAKPKGPWTKPQIKLTKETEYFTRILSHPKVRTLIYSRNAFGYFKGDKYINRINSYIEESFKTPYNYVNYVMRNKERKRMNAKKEKKSKIQIDFERIFKLAKAKEIHRPTVKTKKKKIFSNFGHLNELAVPKFVTKINDPSLPPPPLINPEALKYEATERIRELAALPNHWLNIPPPKIPGYVERGALLYNISERTETLSIPKKQRQKSTDDENTMWTISPNALKYKASQRIIDLAKPRERD